MRNKALYLKREKECAAVFICNVNVTCSFLTVRFISKNKQRNTNHRASKLSGTNATSKMSPGVVISDSLCWSVHFKRDYSSKMYLLRIKHWPPVRSKRGYKNLLGKNSSSGQHELYRYNFFQFKVRKSRLTSETSQNHTRQSATLHGGQQFREKHYIFSQRCDCLAQTTSI